METIPNAPEQERHAEQREQDGNQTPPRYYFRTTIISNLLVAFATIAIWVNSCVQIYNTRRDLRAYVTLVADQAKGITLQERAYALNYKPQPLQQQLHVHFGNSGRSPATNIAYCAARKVVDFDMSKTGMDVDAYMPDDLGCPTNERVAAEMILQAGTISGQVDKHYPLLSDSDTAEIFAYPPTKVVVFYGCISYDDIFDVRHCTMFCSYYNATNQDLYACGKHNDLDKCAPFP